MEHKADTNPGPKGISNTVLRRILKRVISLYRSVLHIDLQVVLPTRTETQVWYILSEVGRDSTPPMSYRTFSLLDTADKLCVRCFSIGPKSNRERRLFYVLFWKRSQFGNYSQYAATSDGFPLFGVKAWTRMPRLFFWTRPTTELLVTESMNYLRWRWEELLKFINFFLFVYIYFCLLFVYIFVFSPPGYPHNLIINCDFLTSCWQHLILHAHAETGSCQIAQWLRIALSLWPSQGGASRPFHLRPGTDRVPELRTLLNVEGNT